MGACDLKVAARDSTLCRKRSTACSMSQASSAGGADGRFFRRRDEGESTYLKSEMVPIEDLSMLRPRLSKVGLRERFRDGA